MIFEGQLRPFRRDGSELKSNEMHVHELPWPTRVLEDLGAAKVRLRITLSYFIEPSPGRRGWTRRYRYASHGLRFDLKRPLESLDKFISRLSKSALEDEVEEGPSSGHGWVVGTRGRTHGSLHSDWLETSAAELAASGHIAVFPVTGWWRERQNQQRWDSDAPYSLIVSIETDAEDVQLYTAIKARPKIAIMT